MNPYANMTQNDFDIYLDKLTDQASKAEILSLPGVYEIVAEAYNNEVLKTWAEENAQKLPVHPKVYESEFGYGFVGCDSDDYETEQDASLAAWENDGVFDSE